MKMIIAINKSQLLFIFSLCLTLCWLLAYAWLFIRCQYLSSHHIKGANIFHLVTINKDVLGLSYALLCDALCVIA